MEEDAAKPFEQAQAQASFNALTIGRGAAPGRLGRAHSATRDGRTNMYVRRGQQRGRVKGLAGSPLRSTSFGVLGSGPTAAPFAWLERSLFALGLPGLCRGPKSTSTRRATAQQPLVDLPRDTAVDVALRKNGTVVAVRYGMRRTGGVGPANIAHALLSCAPNQRLRATARSQMRRISAEKGPTTIQCRRKATSTSATRVSVTSREPPGGPVSASNAMATRGRRKRPGATAVVGVGSTSSRPSTSVANRSRGRSAPRSPRRQRSVRTSRSGVKGAQLGIANKDKIAGK
jgi:hypothetical protein